MKKIYTLIAGIMLTASVFAQAPEKMSYQAVVRDASNALVTMQAVGMQISILQGGAIGTPVYIETQIPTTNSNGLVSIEIGTGTVVSGTFATIDWANGPYFIKTETDPTGGTSYTITGTSQLLSVPYALHANTADSILGGVSYTETDPIFGASIANGITRTDTTYWNNKLDSYTETDPIFGASIANGITATDTTYWNNKLDSYTETDPIFGTSIANGITATDTTYWNNKLDSYTETDPIFGASIANGITGTDTTYWNNKLDNYTENDPIFGASVASGITTTDTTYWNNKQDQISAGSNIIIVGNTISTKVGGSSNKFYLGQDTLGGIVFYIYLDQNGNQRGLIVSKTETTAQWQSNTSITNASRGWDGAYNTNLMTNSPAKSWITANFSTDWYLPSIDELSILWHNRFHADKALNAGNFALLSLYDRYWSSTEGGTTDAWFFRFLNGYTTGSTNKTTAFRVRAVRAF